MASVHRIHRQRWSIRVDQPAEALRWRQRLRDNWQQELLPVMADVFDAFDQPGQQVHLPRLHLQLKVGSLAQLREQLPIALAQALRDEWHESANTSTPSISSPQQGTDAHAADDIVRHYLQRGELPWQAAHGDRQQQQQRLLLTPEYWRQLLREQLALAPSDTTQLLLIWRWLQQVASAERQTELRQFVCELAADASFAEPVGALLHLLSSMPAMNGYQLLQWQSLLALRLWQHLHSSEPSSVTSAALDDVIRATVLPAGVTQQAPSLALLQWLERGARVPPQQTVIDVGASLLSPMSEAAAAGPEAKPSLHAALLQAAASSQPVLPYTTTDVASVSVLVLHAGLVLLHPFLPQFFRACGVWAMTESRLSPWQLPHAAALLHFLATGSEAIAEHECGTIKLLLGLAVDASLPVAEGLLSDLDKAEIEQLLNAVIGHWSALKQTSATGLRLSFLQRPGLLRAEPDGWRLHIEREAFDVLLDFLPWGIGVIKLPWMTDAIHTAW